MSVTSDHYLACAAQSLREADESLLDNVRARCLRSAAAWQAMAERAVKIESERLARAAVPRAGAEPAALGAAALTGTAAVAMPDHG